jgi:hypothetical protein
VGAVFVPNLSPLSVVEVKLFCLRAVLSHTVLYTDGRFVDPRDSDDPVFDRVTAVLTKYVRKLNGVIPPMIISHPRAEIRLDQIPEVRAAAMRVIEKYSR